MPVLDLRDGFDLEPDGETNLVVLTRPPCGLVRVRPEGRCKPVMVMSWDQDGVTTIGTYCVDACGIYVAQSGKQKYKFHLGMDLAVSRLEA